jgi:hypothetical protein
MIRRAPSALLSILLLLLQILQGGMAVAMPCAADVSDFVVCGAAHDGSAGTEHASPAGNHTHPAPAHCRLCDSGACRMTHSPALSVVLPPIQATLPQSVATPQPRIEHFTAPFEEILRPPK